MEGTIMKKKEYMKPTLYVAILRPQFTLMAGSVQRVVAKEGDTDLNLKYPQEEGDMWNNGW
jgi:hypothetical protein